MELKPKIVLFFFLSLTTSLFSQNKAFKNMNFNQDGWGLLILETKIQIESEIDTLQGYYTFDK
jgi:hypothetical protein